MIVLCSNNQSILQRWSSFLNDTYSLQHSHSLTDLDTQLHNRPDLVILHDKFFIDNKANQLKDLIKSHEAIKFLVLSDKPDEQTAFDLLHSGVYGYSNTYITSKLLIDAVKRILNGDVWMGKRLTRYLSECLLEDINDESTEETAFDAEGFMLKLTPREKEVAQRIAHGCSNKCVANKLNITERTVKAHLSSIFQKTGIKDRVHLALILNSHKYD